MAEEPKAPPPRREGPPRHQVVATITSTVAAVIASATAVMTGVQATRAIQDQARMALFQRQVDACIDYSKSARAFTQNLNVTVALSMMRLNDDKLTPDEDKLFTDAVGKLQQSATEIVDGTDNVKLVIPDAKVHAAVEAGHQKAADSLGFWQASYTDAAKLAQTPDKNIALEAQFEEARSACRTYLSEVMSGRQGIR